MTPGYMARGPGWGLPGWRETVGPLEVRWSSGVLLGRGGGDGREKRRIWRAAALRVRVRARRADLAGLPSASGPFPPVIRLGKGPLDPVTWLVVRPEPRAART